MISIPAPFAYILRFLDSREVADLHVRRRARPPQSTSAAGSPSPVTGTQREPLQARSCGSSARRMKRPKALRQCHELHHIIDGLCRHS